MSTNNLVIQLNLESRLHKISGAMGLSNLFINAAIAIQEQEDKIAELEKKLFESTREADKAVLRAAEMLIYKDEKIVELESNQASEFLKFVKSSDKIGNITKLQFHALFVAFNQTGDL